ncbi:hypothetical protein CASFOL_014361 [Castilleja foliolosa]|uniref:ATP-dependent DNA helicase n=1 Tax=Castilleja foliolosa TaxID=1961234 RepID=A0ABD3DPD9_9LAMI
MFTAWFLANIMHPKLGESLTYPEFPQKFVWNNDAKMWFPRKRGFSLGRAYYVPPGSGEAYYQRCLINVIRGATCHEDMMKVNNVQYNTYKDACYALGMIEDDKEYIDAINEASKWASAKSLQRIFCTLLLENCMQNPVNVWDSCWMWLSDDILHSRRKLLHNQLTEEEIKNLALIEIEIILRRSGGSLKYIDSMPQPDFNNINSSTNRMIMDELDYDIVKLEEDLNVLKPKMTDEHKKVFDVVLDSVYSNKGKTYFLYDYGGTGKTFVWRILSAAIRCKKDIVLNVASSGIASLLLPGGRTAHSRFKIPLSPHETSTCNIKMGTELAELVVLAKLIIWDEAPMMSKYCFEALDRTLRDIMKVNDRANFDKPFGGKTIVFGGDFRQILPVIPKGSRQDVVNATINASYIWRNCEVLRLTKNMRLQSMGSSDESVQLTKFAEWIAKIGDGTVGDEVDGAFNVQIPQNMLIQDNGDPIDSLAQVIYPNIEERIDDPKYLQDRAILAPTLDVVDAVNEYMIEKMSGDCHKYFSSNTVCKSDSAGDMLGDVHMPEFLNSIKCSGVPNHELNLKVGTPVMLLRNIDPSNGLCNGTRLLITRLGSYVLECKILTGHNASEKVLIPRLSSHQMYVFHSSFNVDSFQS